MIVEVRFLEDQERTFETIKKRLLFSGLGHMWSEATGLHSFASFKAGRF